MDDEDPGRYPSYNYNHRNDPKEEDTDDEMIVIESDFRGGGTRIDNEPVRSWQPPQEPPQEPTNTTTVASTPFFSAGEIDNMASYVQSVWLGLTLGSAIMLPFSLRSRNRRNRETVRLLFVYSLLDYLGVGAVRKVFGQLSWEEAFRDPVFIGPAPTPEELEKEEKEEQARLLARNALYREWQQNVNEVAEDVFLTAQAAFRAGQEEAKRRSEYRKKERAERQKRQEDIHKQREELGLPNPLIVGLALTGGYLVVKLNK